GSPSRPWTSPLGVALPASSRTTHAVAEVLGKGGGVLLHTGRGRCVPVGHCAVDNIEATLPLIQPQLEIGTAAPREVLRPPLNVEDAVGLTATYRCEYAEPVIADIYRAWHDAAPDLTDRVYAAGRCWRRCRRQRECSCCCCGSRRRRRKRGRRSRCRRECCRSCGRCRWSSCDCRCWCWFGR